MTNTNDQAPSTADVDWSAIYLENQRNLKSEASKAAAKLGKIFAHLAELNPALATIEISYDGAGDSGQVDCISYYDTDRKLIAVEDDQPLPDAIADGMQRTPGRWVPGEGFVASGAPRNVSADELLSYLGWDLAYGTNPGFEINEGGYGTITVAASDLDPNEISITLSHSERYFQTIDTTFSF